MTKTNIRKYDELPARVSYLDVDALRFHYNDLTKRLERTIEQLDKAYDKFQKEKQNKLK